ncbi:MAG: hypothetical protein ABI593_07920 [Betaproteobacteria bacterium]
MNHAMVTTTPRIALVNGQPLRSRCRKWAVSLAVGLMLAVACPASADFTGKLVEVVDGDTITVLDAAKTQHRIRLAGIDAPERGQLGGFRA